MDLEKIHLHWEIALKVNVLQHYKSFPLKIYREIMRRCDHKYYSHNMRTHMNGEELPLDYMKIFLKSEYSLQYIQKCPRTP